MALNASLYLQDLPLPAQGKKIVTLTPVTSSGSAPSGSENLSSQQVAAALAAMTESLLESMQKMIQFLAEEAQENAENTQMNVASASTQANQAISAQKAYEASQSFWHQLGAFMLKYVLGPVLATLTLAATIWFAGPAAFAIAAAVLIVTMIPVHNGQGMLSSGVDAAVGAIGKDCGWSQATIDIVQGVVNLVVGIAVGIATGFAATAATAAEVASTAAEAVETTVATELDSATSALESTVSTTLDETGIVAEDGVKTAGNTAEKAAAYKFNAGKFTGISSAAAVITSSNCFNDMISGILTNSGVSDDESKEIAAIVGMIMNLLVMVASFGAGYSSMSSLASDAAEFNPLFKLLGENSALMKLLGGSSSSIGKALSGITSVGLQTAVSYGTVGTACLTADFNLYNSSMEVLAAHYLSKLTAYKGELAFTQGLGSIINQSTQMTNNALSAALKKFDVLEKAPNYSQALFTEAKEMLQASQQM